MSQLFAPGTLIDGKYRIERELGAGGMGFVVLAFHMGLEERVAVKMLLPDALADLEAVSRFSREAKAAARIKSEHVARVSDVGKLDTGSPYMVMEY
ncbi:MAG: serine/threonine-protein kinase, partial [Polyangiaceae bacterium]